MVLDTYKCRCFRTNIWRIHSTKSGGNLQCTNIFDLFSIPILFAYATSRSSPCTQLLTPLCMSLVSCALLCIGPVVCRRSVAAVPWQGLSEQHSRCSIKFSNKIPLLIYTPFLHTKHRPFPAFLTIYPKDSSIKATKPGVGCIFRIIVYQNI